MRWAFTIYVCACTVLTSGGVLFGWGALQTRLKREWGFRNVLCPGVHAVCAGEQQTFLQTLYSGGLLFGVTGGMVLFGLLLDVMGPRLTAACGLAISTVGNLLMAFAPWEAHWMFLPAFILLGLGGMGPFVASHYVVNFWRTKHMILGVVLSCFDSAGFVYIILQYVRWLNRTQWFCIFAGACAVLLVAGLFLFHDVPCQIGEQCVLPALKRIPFFKPSPPSVEETPPPEPKEGDTPPPGMRLVPVAPILKEEEMGITLEECVATPNFKWLVGFFSVSHVITVWLGGAMPDLLSQVGDPQYFSSTLYPMVGSATFLFTPFVAQTLEEQGFYQVIGLSILSLQATIVLVIVPDLWVQLLTLTAYCIAKSFLYTGFSSFIALNYPIQHYPQLVAICLTASLGVGLLNFPLIYFQQHALHGDYVTVLVCAILVLMPLYGFAYRLLQQARVAAAEAAAAAPPQEPTLQP